MNAGLFTLSCPECGGELALGQFGNTSTCTPCERTYLHRFGHLIPIEFQNPAYEDAVLPVRLG